MRFTAYIYVLAATSSRFAISVTGPFSPMSTSINLRQFKSSFDKYKNEVTKVPSKELTFLWFDHFYDGMLSGILEYKNKKCRFEIITDYEKQQIRPRIFAILELTNEQVEDENHWHQLFEQHVGCHSVSPGKDAVLWRPQSEHHLFYEPYQKRKKPNYKASRVIGWYGEE